MPELFGVRQLGDAGDYLHCGTTPSGDVMLEEGESVLWDGSLMLRQGIKYSGDEKFTETDIGDARTVMTDRRIVAIQLNYDTGKKYRGSYLLGGSTSVALGYLATAASKKRAERASRGTVLVGQVRFDWPTKVTYHNLTPAIGGHEIRGANFADIRMDLATTRDEPLYLNLHIGGRSELFPRAERLARFVVARIAAWRAADSSLPREMRLRLRELSRHPEPTEQAGQNMAFDIPGAHEVE